MTFLPVPKTEEEFLKAIGAKHDFELYLSFKRFSDDSIQGTQRFMGGKLWFVFLSVTRNGRFIDIFANAGYWKMDSLGNFGRWIFASIGSKLFSNTEENRKRLNSEILKIGKILSSCSSAEEIIKTMNSMNKKGSEFQKHLEA